MSDQNLLIKISADLATNTEATKNIEKHLSVLNSKVALQESNQGTLKMAFDLQQVTLQGLVDKDKSRSEKRGRIAWLTVENIFKFIFGVCMAYLLYKAGV